MSKGSSDVVILPSPLKRITPISKTWIMDKWMDGWIIFCFGRIDWQIFFHQTGDNFICSINCVKLFTKYPNSNCTGKAKELMLSSGDLLFAYDGILCS